LESAIGTWRFRRVDLPLTREDRAALEQHLYQIAWPATLANLAVTNVIAVDGTRIELADGSWVLIRGSGTEPLLRLYAEAHDSDTVDALLMSARAVLGV
jgi:phosphomannomutase